MSSLEARFIAFPARDAGPPNRSQSLTKEGKSMRAAVAPSPLNRRQLIDEYFIENRTKVLDVAAFLDRLDRAESGEPDFRMEAFVEALNVLCGRGPTRLQAIQMIFSDPTKEPRERLDQKSASGAYDRRREEAR
jgi:hypothetical protein